MTLWQLLLWTLVWSTTVAEALVCMDHHKSLRRQSVSTCRSSSLGMVNGRTREKLRSWFSRRRNVPAATTIATADAMAVAQEPKVVAESVSVIPESPELLESLTTPSKAKMVPATLTRGRNPSQMLLTGQWQVLPRRQSPDYTLQDALATMGIDNNLNSFSKTHT